MQQLWKQLKIENCNIPRKRPSESRQRDFIKNEKVRLAESIETSQERISGAPFEHGLTTLAVVYII